MLAQYTYGVYSGAIMANRELTTVDEVLDELGGTGRVARLTGQKYDQTVSNWRRRGRMPPELFDLMVGELEKLGCCAPAALWKQAPRNDAESEEAHA